jgi:sugar phosphate isomerase/epimerase
MTDQQRYREPRLGLQLYTVRQQMRDDAVATLRKVAAIGYTAVELVGYGNSSAEVVNQVLRDLGVDVIGAHVAYDSLDRDLDRAIADLQLLGAPYLVIQNARAQDWSGAEAVKRLADTFNSWGRRCRAAGLTLAYHGYHPIEQEFAPLDGSTGYDLMVALTDPSLLKIQLDTYWLHRLGRDPVQVLAACAGRVPSLHLKDAAPGGDGADVPVGSGVIAWPEVLAAAQESGLGWLLVEQEDDPGNALRDIAQSLEFLTTDPRLPTARREPGTPPR